MIEFHQQFATIFSGGMYISFAIFVDSADFSNLDELKRPL